MLTRTKLGTILFVHLTSLSLFDSITINNALKVATQRINVQSPSSNETPIRCRFLTAESFPGHIFEVPSNVLQVPRHDRFCRFHGNRDENDTKISATFFPWRNRGDSTGQIGRAYLPPRTGNPRIPYDPLGVLPIEIEDAKFLSPRYSSVSIASRPEVDRGLASSHVGAKNRQFFAPDQARGKNVPVSEDIRPIYEKNIEDDRKSDFDKKRKSIADPTGASSLKNVKSGDSRVEGLRHENDKDSATATSTLDWFLTKGGYNSQLHPPTNPILALVLSHYGRYLPGNEKPKLYSYMAVNNIHNNRPFGRYKHECDEPSEDYGINNLKL